VQRDLSVPVQDLQKAYMKIQQVIRKPNRMLLLIAREYKGYASIMVRPHLEYCALYLLSLYKEECECRFTRLIPGMHRLSYTERLGLLSTGV